MRFLFNRYPVDILVCVIWSFLLLPVAFLQIEGALRIILGLPFIIFIPGYTLIFVLFPNKKTDKGIDVIQRIALSFGVSIAIVSFIALGLNYTSEGIQLGSILVSIFLLILLTSSIAFIRWIKINPDDRFIISFNLNLPKSGNKLDKLLFIMLVAVIVIAASLIVYAMITPRTVEKFTEFYILGPHGIADDYPGDLTLGENAKVIIGIVNHEHQTIDYTVETWLINQSIVFNENTKENETIYHHMWFMDKTSITIDYSDEKTDGAWKSQWEQNYTFSINRGGNYKLAFLLFTEPTDSYNQDEDYKEIAEQKINSAYSNLHLLINVK